MKLFSKWETVKFFEKENKFINCTYGHEQIIQLTKTDIYNFQSEFSKKIVSSLRTVVFILFDKSWVYIHKELIVFQNLTITSFLSNFVEISKNGVMVSKFFLVQHTWVL